MRNATNIHVKSFAAILAIFMLVSTLSAHQGVASSFAGEPTLKASPAQADWPTLDFIEVVSDLNDPVHVGNAGDGTGRLFIVEQAGVVRIYDDNLLDTPFIDISGRVRSPQSGGGSEEGLLSVAFPPGYGDTSQYFYAYYTNTAGNNQVSRFQVTADPNIADPNSEEVVIPFGHPVNSNHNGGQIAFGPDGYLYIGTGDGGGGGDPDENAQDPGSLLGKILRIDVELSPDDAFTPDHWVYLPQIYGATGNGTRPLYRIPPDNPFVGVDGTREEIWALGLRNPWRFSFDRFNGDLYIADVGQQAWEEVDHQPAGSPGGENYGWDNWEASECYEGPCNNPSGFVFPVFDYPNNAENCSVTGGFVYRGQLYPGIAGIYLFTDYCSGTIWGMRYSGQAWETQVLGDPGSSYSSFGEDENGELYLVRRTGGSQQPGTGSIFHIVESVTP